MKRLAPVIAGSTRDVASSHIDRRGFLTVAGGMAASLSLPMVQASFASEGEGEPDDDAPLVIAKQGSFLIGGSVVTNPGTFDPIALTPDGQTIHGDHAYAQYQIPVAARRYPLVMWHGGSQFSKTWESTPDNREGYQSIFLRRGFDVHHRSASSRPVWARYDEWHHLSRARSGRDRRTGDLYPLQDRDLAELLPRRAVSIRRCVSGPVVAAANPRYGRDEQRRRDERDCGIVQQDRAGRVGHAFREWRPWMDHRDQERQRQGGLRVRTGDSGLSRRTGAGAGPVRPLGPITGTPIPLADFMKLTKIPIEIIWGDNFPTANQSPSIYPDIEIWQGRIIMAQKFVDLVNSLGGNARLVHLPDIGIFGNTHFAMSDLNNVQIADLLSKLLREHNLGRR